MANIFSDFAALQNTAGGPSGNFSTAPNENAYGGNLKFVSVTKTAIMATADPLYLIRLPKGARLIPQLCSVDYEDPGDAMVCSIGDFTCAATPVVIDVDRYATALDLGNAAGRKFFSEAGTKGVAFLTPFTLTVESWIVVTWTTATVAISGKQTWNLAYTLG